MSQTAPALGPQSIRRKPRRSAVETPEADAPTLAADSTPSPDWHAEAEGEAYHPASALSFWARPLLVDPDRGHYHEDAAAILSGGLALLLLFLILCLLMAVPLALLVLLMF